MLSLWILRDSILSRLVVKRNLTSDNFVMNISVADFDPEKLRLTQYLWLSMMAIHSKLPVITVSHRWNFLGKREQ